MARTVLSVVIVALFSGCFLASCSPTQAYSGPRLPDDQVAIVYLQYDSDDIDLQRATTNGVEFGYSGVSVLPGKAYIEVSAGAKEPPRNCQRCIVEDSYAYSQCQDDYYSKRDSGKSVSYCRWEDYTDVRERCEQEIHDASCEINFNVRAGQKYDLRIIPAYGDVSLSAAERGAASSSSNAKCSTFRSRTEPTDSYIGSGRYTSIYGLSHCD